MSNNLRLNNNLINCDKNIAIVIGVYVNGYHIIKGLSKNKIPIIAIDFKKNPGVFSKHVSQCILLDYLKEEQLLVGLLISIGKQLNKKAVLFPTHDHHTKLFAENYTELQQYYNIPVNPETLPQILSKECQYKVCAETNIPYPKTFFLKNEQSINEMLAAKDNILYPLIIKPFSRVKDSGLGNVFRVKEIKNKEDLERVIEIIRANISSGFIVSEIIPGEPDNIWAYTAYCDEKSNIVAGWTGRKLTQRPYYFGVFSTARFEKNEIVEKQGRDLLKAFKHIGVGEPEFKYDYRDQTYKLMEINPRYMMWHGVSIKGGMNLPLINYYHAIGDETSLAQISHIQSERKAHLVFMYHEFCNVFDHKPKIKFIKNIIKALFLPNKIWGIFDIKDIKPYLRFKMNILLEILLRLTGGKK